MQRRVFNRLVTPLLVAVAACCSVSQANAKDTVKIAFVGPLTGGNSAIGIGGRNSADLAVRERNADPKAKYHYELVSLDDECKPDVGVQVVTKIASDRSIIGALPHFCSAVAMGTVDIFHRFGLPMIVWGAVLPDITYAQKIPEVHRVNGTMINQNEVAAQFMTKLGYKSWVVMHDTTDYGNGHAKYFTQYLTKNGGKVLADIGVTADQQDFTAELTRIKQIKPQVVYFGGLTPLGVRIRAQMDKLGVPYQFEGTSGIKSDAYISGVGAPLAEGTLSFVEGAPWETLPGGKAFAASYEKQNYGASFESYGPFSYVAANLMIDTIEKEGPNRRKVTQALAKVKNVDTILGKVSFDDHGQNIVPLISKYVVQDGQWVLWEHSDYASGKRKLKGL